MDQTLNALNAGHVSPLLVIIIIWSVAWKGFALWRAATLRQKKWFIAITILNTFGILEIVYLFFFNQKRNREVVTVGDESEGSMDESK